MLQLVDRPSDDFKLLQYRYWQYESKGMPAGAVGVRHSQSAVLTTQHYEFRVEPNKLVQCRH
jgi:hypothetical protein